MPRQRRAAILPTNIALLQNLIRRDPESYKEEFKLQHDHYASLRDIFFQNPRSLQGTQEFTELLGFMTQMCSCYPKETDGFSAEISNLLVENHSGLHVVVAEKLIHCLSMLRNKGILSNDTFVQTLWPVLLNTESKQLRTQVYSTLIQMIKNANEPSKAPQLNRMVQALLFNLLEDATANGLWATKITRELWRRGLWDDSRSVEIMTHAAVHDDPKVAISGIRFFLGADRERSEALDAEESDSDLDMGSIKHQMKINKKSRKRTKQMESAVRTHKRYVNGLGKDATHLNFSAIHLLRDPQGFSERLFSKHLQNSKGGFKLTMDQKVECTNLVARLVGTHKLIVLGFYSWIQRYLTPKQVNVTQFLAAAAQSAHNLVPPDVIGPVVRKIADEFVSDGVAAEVAAAGLNAIREILVRTPLAIEQPLLHDLIAYKGSKSKPVVIAARSLVQLYRQIDPSLLPVKERGKVATMALRAGETHALKYGEEKPSEDIAGLDLLAKADNVQDEDGKDAWEVASGDESDSSEGWINIESDQDYNISDSDDDKDDVDQKNEPEEVNQKDKSEEVSLASREILTPADFQKLDKLRAEHGMRKAMGQSNEEIIEAMELAGPQKFKQNKEERLAHVQQGREGREFGSRKRLHAEKNHSTTNKEKARKKNFVMMIHKRDVQGKARKSLRDKQKVLRAHIDRQKKRK